KRTIYFVYKYGFGLDSKVIWCYSGFSSILIRLLQNKYGYTINGKELYRAKEITRLPNMLFSLWNFQKDAIESWINSNCYGIIQAPTGSGKGILGCSVIKKMNLRTIILVHTSDLLINVWYNYIIQQFGEEIKDRIGIIGGGLSSRDRKMMRIIDNDFNANIKKDIVIATSQSLLAGNKLTMLGEERFGLMVIDEIHHYSAEQFKKVAGAVRAAYRLGLSSTLKRPDGLSPIFYALLGDVRYRIGIKELVKKGLLVEPIFYSIIIDDEEACSKIRNCNYKLLEYSRYIKKVSGSSELKFRYILGLCQSLKSKGRRFMLYTDFVNKNTGIDEDGTFDAESVFTRDDYVKGLLELKIKVIGISSEMSGLERQSIFTKLGNNELDGIVFANLGNEGINIPSVDSIIMCNATASTIKFPQRTGRAMRLYKNKKNCFVYEILLNTPKELQWSEDNFLEYEEQGFKKEKIYVNNDGYLIKKEIKQF
ncbi:MAG: DEAD/DEAH box helicase, partial [Gallionella sp.]|nr:DEAD/DEAH box helicase [Gallionella sp.]